MRFIFSCIVFFAPTNPSLSSFWWSSPFTDLDRAAAPHRTLHPLFPPLLRIQPYAVGQPPHTCIPSWTSHPPTTPTASHSTALCSQLPGLFIGPVSFPHLQGGRVVTVGPRSLSGILHRNENAPCWCRNLFLSLSPSRLARCHFVVDVRCSMWCRDNTENGNRRKRIPVRCAPYIDMDYTFRNNHVCAVGRAPAGYHTCNASRVATASLRARLNTNGTGKAKCGDTYKFLFFLLRFSFFSCHAFLSGCSGL